MNLKLTLLLCLALIEVSPCTSSSSAEQPIDHMEDYAFKKEKVKSEDKFEELWARMEAMEAREKAREQEYILEIRTLRRQLSDQSRRTSSLERVVRQLFRGGVRAHGDTNQELKDSIRTDERSLKLQARSDYNSGRIRRADVEHQVAFFAKLTKHMTHVGAHQQIVFDNVETNIGDAYNNHVGAFIAPVPGTYVFSTTLFTQYHINYHAQFVKNGHPLTFMYLSGSEAGYDTTSQTIVLQLQKGDDVSVQNYDADKPIYGINYTTFAGFLLHEEFQGQQIVG